jgi:hypothetical protein
MNANPQARGTLATHGHGNSGLNVQLGDTEHGRNPEPVVLERRDSSQPAADLCRAKDVGVSIRKRIDACSQSKQVAFRHRPGKRTLFSRRHTEFTNSGNAPEGAEAFLESVHGGNLANARR